MLTVVVVSIFILLEIAAAALSPASPYLQSLKECVHNGPLGMSTGEIQNSQISASSNYPPEWDKGCHERYARIYQPNGLGWCAKFKSASEWLQVDLGVPAKVTGLMTQGRGDGAEWVSSFLVSFSVDAYHWQYVTDQYGNQRIFEGNTDSYSVKHSYLDESIIARFIKFHTAQWHRHPSMRVEVIGCQVCKSAIALPPYGKVLASSEKSSEKGNACRAEDGYIITNKAWCSKQDDVNQWLQFDIGPPTLVTGLVTRGRGDSGKNSWVSRFRVSYSNDSTRWHFYTVDSGGLKDNIKDFAGNTDRDHERYQYLGSPFIARFVRIHPIDWHRHISMRAGLLGCPYIGTCAVGFMRVNENTPCVENLVYQKESFINNKRQYKRHIQNQWLHGHAARAVDGEAVQTIHSCTILDNFYVEKPIWMVDIGRKATVSGVVILTWVAGKSNDPRTSYQDYMHNLEKLAVYVDNRGGKDDIDKEENHCGFLTRVNDALFKPKLHVSCSRPMKGRYVYVEASGVPNRWSRLFGAVLCEVMVYE